MKSSQKYVSKNDIPFRHQGVNQMNLFLLHKNLKICARQHCDRHVVKMILELAQLLSTAWWIANPEDAEELFQEGIIYKKTHVNHPVAIWTREHENNYVLVAELAIELCNEYTFRYGKVHKTEEKILFFMDNIPQLDKSKKDLVGPWNTTPPKQCFPDHLKNKNPIKGYRNYYNECKRHIFSWKKRQIPVWIED